METRREGLKRANTWVLFNTRELLLQVPRAHIDRSCTNLLSQRHAKSSTHLLRIHKLFIASPAYRLGHFSLSSFDPKRYRMSLPRRAHQAALVGAAAVAVATSPFPLPESPRCCSFAAASGFKGLFGSYPTALTIPRPLVRPSRNRILSPAARNSGLCTNRKATVALSPVRI